MSLLKRKQFWVNIVALAAAILATVNIDVPPDAQVAIVGGIMAVVNVVHEIVRGDTP